MGTAEAGGKEAADLLVRDEYPTVCKHCGRVLRYIGDVSTSINTHLADRKLHMHFCYDCCDTAASYIDWRYIDEYF